MKKIILLAIGWIYFNSTGYMQQGTTGAPGNSSDWKRGGNTAAPPGLGGTDNIFGTFWNSPIYTYTDASPRTKLNGTVAYPVNGLAGVRNGFFLLGNNSNVTGGSLYDATHGAFSLFHLNGNSNGATIAQEFGYRIWMRTGITYTDNGDRAYVGYKANSLDVSDFVINWSDNSISGGPGPDNLIFNFTAGTGSGNDDIGGDHPNGREVARMTGYGYMGIGPRFNNGQTTGQPQSLLHLNNANSRQAWLQFGNQINGQMVTDGLRLGVVGDIENPANPLNIQTIITPEAIGFGMLYNQENKHLLFSTNAPTNLFDGTNSTRERMRITNYSAFTLLPDGTYGTFQPDPLNIPANQNISRVSISHNPANPVTRPLSLLHLGYNTGQVSFTPGATDGWRAWMEIGMFTSNGTDNAYFGLKQEKASPLNPTDRFDAVVSWGDNQAQGFPLAGPDNLRFIFTSTQTGSPTTFPANGFDGLEAMRMTPTLNTGVFSGIGGDQNANQYFGGSMNPTNTLEVNSWGNVTAPGGSSGLRFTDLNSALSSTIPNPGPGVLAVDANGDVIYVPDKRGLGNYCGEPSNPLVANYEIPMAGFNLYMHGGNSVQIGDVAGCVGGSPARLYVRNNGLLPEGIRAEAFFPNGIAGRFSAPTGTPGNAALVIDGDGWANGSMFGSGFLNVVSDAALKGSITNLTDASSIIKLLNPVSFYFTNNAAPQLNFASEKQYGFVAQEVEQILPELVKDATYPARMDTNGVSIPAVTFKSLNYNAFISILTKGMQEQQEVIEQQQSTITDLNDRLTQLENCVANLNLCNGGNGQSMMQNGNGSNGGNLNVTNTELSDTKSIILDQNVPNPFAEQTTITFMLTEGVQKAQMLFYNLEGKLINSVDVSNKSGKGQLNVFANDLSSGIYTYTLVVDGKIIDTKRMIKQK